MKTTIIKDSSPQAKQFAAHARKTAVVKFYPPVLFSHVAKNPYTLYVYPKLFRRKQDIQNTYLKDWTGMAKKQRIMYHPTQSRILIEKYAYLRVARKRSVHNWFEASRQDLQSLKSRGTIEVAPDTNKGFRNDTVQ